MSDAPAATTAHGRRAAVRLVPPRSDRLQVCLSREEKAQIAEQARRAVFENLSDYVRARTLEQHEQEYDVDARV